MKVVSLLSLLVLFSCQPESAPPFNKLIGDWIRVDVPKNEKTVEHWEILGDSIIGYGRTFVDDSLRFEESLSIEHKDKYYYAVRGVNESTTMFQVREWDESGFSAYNEENEFPKYIRYLFRQNAMFVQIGDSANSIDFNFIRLD